MIEIEQSQGEHDLDMMRVDPAAGLTQAGQIALEFDSGVAGDCGVLGYYRPSSPHGPSITVHPAVTRTRDNFTILHELAHHLQYATLEWADVWVAMDRSYSRLLNERVADTFAAEVLLPPKEVCFDAGTVTAADLAALHQATPSASRSAIAHRAIANARPADSACVAVVDHWSGDVVFAASVGNVMRPRTGASQKSLVTLARAADSNGGRSAANLQPGLVAASGVIQDGLTATYAVDFLGTYAFAVARPLHRYQAPEWNDPEFECSNAACGEIFTARRSSGNCVSCDSPRCPACSTCSCDETSPTCTGCFMTLSTAERTEQVPHDCW